MAIQAPEPPDEALDAVRESLARRRPRRRAPLLRRGPPARPPSASVTAPQRVYTVGLEALAARESVERTAEPTGWRFLVEEPEQPLVAAEVQDLTRAAVPAQVTEGAYVHSTADALRAAEALDVVREGDFELRLLRVPALYLVALWLQAPDRDDVFVPLAPAPSPFEAGRPYSEPEFAGAAAALAREALARVQGAERPDELGG